METTPEAGLSPALKHLLAFIDTIQPDDVTVSENDSVYRHTLSCCHEVRLREWLGEYFNRYPQTIPKRIHQVWIGNNPAPMKWINSFRDKFVKRFPGWEHILWTERELERFPLINKYLFDCEPVLSGKVDILRYELLFRFGGIYIDADMEWLNEKPLDELLSLTNQSGIFAGWEDEIMLANSVIGCSPHNPLMYYAIRLLGLTLPATRFAADKPVWIASGPRFFSEAMKPADITRFPQSCFYPVSWLQNPYGLDTTRFPDSYMIQYGYTTNGMSSDDLQEI